MKTSIKTCFKCLVSKDLSEFYKHLEMRDGHLNKCKDCTRTDVKLHRRSEKFRDKVLAYDRARGNRQSDDYHREYRIKNSSVYKAHCAVNNAVRDGRLMKPEQCEKCGTVGKLHGHHSDYSDQLNVTWLCCACHSQFHALLKTTKS